MTDNLEPQPLMARLKKAAMTAEEEGLVWVADQMTEAAATLERVERERDKAVLAMSEYASRLGEMEGKYKAAHWLGIVDGWIDRCKAAESQVEALRKALEEIEQHALSHHAGSLHSTWREGLSKIGLIAKAALSVPAEERKEPGLNPVISSRDHALTLRAALEEIRDLKPREKELPADHWDQIRACPECQRYAGHPVQQGICDAHRRPMWDREKHNAHEESILGYRAMEIARNALASSPERKTECRKAEESAVYPHREAIARLVDPRAWELEDEGAFAGYAQQRAVIKTSLAKADAILALFRAEARSESAAQELAAFLVQQVDEPEPFSNMGARGHYWRDKCIEAGRRLDPARWSFPAEARSARVGWQPFVHGETALDFGQQYAFADPATRRFGIRWAHQPEPEATWCISLRDLLASIPTPPKAEADHG